MPLSQLSQSSPSLHMPETRVGYCCLLGFVALSACGPAEGSGSTSGGGGTGVGGAAGMGGTTHSGGASGLGGASGAAGTSTGGSIGVGGATGGAGMGSGGDIGSGGATGGAGMATGGTAGAAGAGGSGDTPTDGCGQPWTPTDGEEVGRNVTMIRHDREITVTHEDENPDDSSVLVRRYWLVLPPDYDPNQTYALVFGIHGRSGDREQLRGYVNMEVPANGKAIFIYPEGLLRDGSDTGWQNDSLDSEDLSFMGALFQKYTSELCIDEDRVFAYGHSWGGNMSNRMGCALSFIRGIGPIAGSGPRPRQGEACAGSVPAMIVHNPADGITDVSQGLGAREYWVSANNCTSEEDFEAYLPGVPIELSGDETTPPTLNNYLGCDAGFPVVWVEHHYTRNDNHNPPPWAPAVIWDFFSSL